MTCQGSWGTSGRGKTRCQVIFCNPSLCIFIIFQCQDLEKQKPLLLDAVQIPYSLSKGWIYSFVNLFNRHIEGKQCIRHNAKSPERQEDEHDSGPGLHEIQQIQCFGGKYLRHECRTIYALIFSSIATKYLIYASLEGAD